MIGASASNLSRAEHDSDSNKQSPPASHIPLALPPPVSYSLFMSSATPATKPTKPYTKKQVAALQSAIAGAWINLRDMGLRAEAFRAALPEKRLAVVLGGIRERIAWHEDHATRDRASADHFRAHPEVYGKSTPEMIERFTAGAAKYDKGAAWFLALEQRVLADGLPSEVSTYDPTA